MKTSLDHLPPIKRFELARVVEIIHEEFEDALKGATANFKKRGRVLKIVLFGSYSRGTFVDEPHTKKGYRSDYDILIIVNTRKLAAHEYWVKAEDRLIRAADIKTPISLLVHGIRDVNKALRDSQYFFVDIKRDGIALYEIDDTPLAEPKELSEIERYRIAKSHFERMSKLSKSYLNGARFYIAENDLNLAAFNVHQAAESAYCCLLLTATNYSPATHNLRFLRSLAENTDQRLITAWPRDQNRFTAWFSLLNEAYVKARYSPHFEIDEEGVRWLIDRADLLRTLVEIASKEFIEKYRQDADPIDHERG